ncbi:MAG: hypothetical protein ACRCUT_00890, partial [Spirochaetota bacterium]
IFIFANMGSVIFAMLYRKDETGDDAAQNTKEHFDIIHFAILSLLVMLICLAVFSPDILKETIINITKDFGISL